MRRITKRGLFVQQTDTVSSKDEPEEFGRVLRELSDDLHAHMEAIREVCRRVLGAAGYDADTLFVVANLPNGSRGWPASLIDEQALSTEVYQVLRILKWLELVRLSGDLTDAQARGALYRGMMLATAVEHWNANQLWERSVSSRRRSDQGLAKNRPKGRPATKAQQILALANHYRADRDQAGKIAAKAKCSTAYVRKILGQPKKKNAHR